MRSVVFGNLIVCKHVFDNYPSRFPHQSRDLDFDNREDRIEIARFIKSVIDCSVKVEKPDGQTIFVYMPQDAPPVAFPADIGPTRTKIVTSYPAGPSLVNKAKLLQ